MNAIELESECLKKIILLEHIKDDSFSYVDRNGNKRFVYQLLDGSFYFFGDSKYFQEAFSIEKDGTEKIKFREGGMELSLEEMIMSQLKGKGNYFYFKDPFIPRLRIGNKSDLDKLARIDPIVLGGVYLKYLESKKE